MEPFSFQVQVLDNTTRRPLTGLLVELYNYGVSIDELTGTITGTLATPNSGTDEGTVIATDKGNGFYEFTQILPGWYTVVVSGPGIALQILDGWERFNPFPMPSGSDIPYKQGETVSIASKIEQLEINGSPGLASRVTTVEEELNTIEQDVTSIEGDIIHIEQDIDGIEGEVDIIEVQLDALEEEVHELPIANVFDPTTYEQDDVVGVEEVSNEKQIVAKKLNEWKLSLGEHFICRFVQTDENNPAVTPHVNEFPYSVAIPVALRESIGTFLINFTGLVVDGSVYEKCYAPPITVIDDTTNTVKGTLHVNFDASIAYAYGEGIYVYTFDNNNQLADNIASSGVVLDIIIFR